MFGDIDGGHDHVMIISGHIDVEDGGHVPYRSSINMVKTGRFTVYLIPCIIFNKLEVAGGQDVIIYKISYRSQGSLAST